jgi:hypothetical protein
MLDKEEVLKLETAVKEMQLKLHRHYIEEVLYNCRIKAGDKVMNYGRLYQVLDMEKLEEYNRVGGYISLYGRLVKKNGELGEVVHELSSYSLRPVKE